MEGELARLVVGLGNPGPKYAGTRHNVGFLAVERLVLDCGETWSCAQPGPGETSRVRLGGGTDVRLIKPHTYMNASGDMVSSFAGYFKIPHHAVLVVADDFNLPLGRIRIRKKGSSGGQNGLDSILRRFGSQDVPRVRLGIGPVPPQYDPADFVLGRFAKSDADELDDMISRAADAIRVCCEKGITAAMNGFNGEAA